MSSRSLGAAASACRGVGGGSSGGAHDVIEKYKSIQFKKSVQVMERIGSFSLSLECANDRVCPLQGAMEPLPKIDKARDIETKRMKEVK